MAIAITICSMDAFKRGDFAFVTNASPKHTESSQVLFAKTASITISPGLNGAGEHRPEVTIPLGGLAPASLEKTHIPAYPAFIVSDALMRRIFGEVYAHEVRLDVLPGYEQQTLKELKALTQNMDVGLISKQEALDEIQNATFILFVLGGGISLIIALIGILNFVNVMSTGIVVRKNELVILESIGMEKRKIRQMLIFEGVGYASIALLLTATFGNAAAYGVFRLFQLQLFQMQNGYVVFQYPFLPVAVMAPAGGSRLHPVA